jgi:hypothetical protein
MEGVHFDGRGFPSPQLQFTFTEGRVLLRVDDELNPEAWVQIDLTESALMKMLSEIHDDYRAKGEVLDMLLQAWDPNKP